MTAPAMTSYRSPRWDRAECAGLDPSWWYESRKNWQDAVQLCISCPVRAHCHEDAIRSGDIGVVRGASFFTDDKRGRRILSLVCEACGCQPVVHTQTTVSRMCIHWTAQEILTRAVEVVTVLGEAMVYDRAGKVGSLILLDEQRQLPGFRAAAALGRTGEVIGFVYGYTCEPGQRWHDWVSRFMSKEVREQWLTNAFAVAELNVLPAYHGLGLGEALLDRCLQQVAARTVVLSTAEAEQAESPAWRLYRRWGFVDVCRQIGYPGEPRTFAVLGWDRVGKE
jgi:ribosomal protein S18 acetylase RimI-like enzyme